MAADSGAFSTFGPVAARADASERVRLGRRELHWLPARDAPIEMRYRDATRMGKIYLMPRGVDAAGRRLGRAWARTRTIRR